MYELNGLEIIVVPLSVSAEVEHRSHASTDKVASVGGEQASPKESDLDMIQSTESERNILTPRRCEVFGFCLMVSPIILMFLAQGVSRKRIRNRTDQTFS